MKKAILFLGMVAGLAVTTPALAKPTTFVHDPGLAPPDREITIVAQGSGPTTVTVCAVESNTGQGYILYSTDGDSTHLQAQVITVGNCHRFDAVTRLIAPGSDTANKWTGTYTIP